MTWQLLRGFGLASASAAASASAPRESIDSPWRCLVLAGLPGVGKTEALRFLASHGAAVLDLEALAAHRGSVFGAIPGVAQPSHREFGERVLTELVAARGRVLWIEDEGPYIGSVGVPADVQRLMQGSARVELRCTREDRVQRLLREYGQVREEVLLSALERLRSRLDGRGRQLAQQAAARGDLRSVVEVVLPYYDAAYARRWVTPHAVLEIDERHAGYEIMRRASDWDGWASAVRC